MILPERVLGRPGPTGSCPAWRWGRFRHAEIDQPLAQFLVGFHALHRGDVGVDALALDVVGKPTTAASAILSQYPERSRPRRYPCGGRRR